MSPFNKNQTLSDTYWRVQVVCMKVQTHSSLEPPLEYNQDETLLVNQVCYDLFNQIGGYRNIMQFKISYKRESR